MINLYSDTQTVPTENMRKAIAEAEVGDEHSRSDPTTLLLEKKVAELLGKEEAVFLPSGTMCNLIGVAINTSPGDVIMLESNGHILRSETGGPAVVSSVLTDPIDGERGQFTASQIEQRSDEPIQATHFLDLFGADSQLCWWNCLAHRTLGRCMYFC